MFSQQHVCCLSLLYSPHILHTYPNKVGEAIGLELRTSGSRPYLHTQLFTGFMYIGASLCAGLLRILKARSAGKAVNDSGNDDDDDGYFRIRDVRLWKRV